MARRDEVFRCTFCKKTHREVRKLIAGSRNIFICDECVQLCGEIMDDGTGIIRPGFRVEAERIVVVTSDKEFAFPITTTDPEVWARFCQYVKELAQEADETSAIRNLKAELKEAEKRERAAAEEIAALQKKIAMARAERLAAGSEAAAKKLPVNDANLPAKPE